MKKIRRIDTIKVFLLVSILIFSGLGLTLSTTGSGPNDTADGISSAGMTTGLGGSREARQASGPMVACTNMAPATPIKAFVGEQDVSFDVTLESLFEDDNDDTNGDNVLYNISILGVNPSTEAGSENNLQKFDYQTR